MDNSTDSGIKINPESTLPKAIDYSPGKAILGVALLFLVAYLTIVYVKHSRN